MPEEFDPAWEYALVDPEIEEAVYGDRAVKNFDALPMDSEAFESKAVGFGFRFGRKNPDAYLPYKSARPKHKLKESKDKFREARRQAREALTAWQRERGFGKFKRLDRVFLTAYRIARRVVNVTLREEGESRKEFLFWLTGFAACPNCGWPVCPTLKKPGALPKKFCSERCTHLFHTKIQNSKRRNRGD